ncbi:MAG: IS66 family transposase, partial [Bacteriovorax sp.]|nr:IS66 family transposase [Bacteriovorax sp.]
MFDEAEFESLKDEEASSEEEGETIIVPGHERAKRGKRIKLPESLPREIVEIDLDSKICSIDGSELKCIGEEISEKLEIIPAKVKVLRTIRKKYACSKCESITTAPAPLELIPKSIASSSLLAYVASAKYVDALPLYRQEAIFKRIGIDLHRQTMARWMITIGEKIEPLIKLLREELLDSSYLHMDETTVQVLNEEGKKAQSKSYMWVQARSGVKPIILFHYAKKRSAQHSELLLEDFSGYLHVDGYDGYAPVCEKNQITRLGCWAHARRKFFDAFKSSQGNVIGKQGLVFIKKLYEVEDKIRGLSSSEKLERRQNESLKITNEFKEWVDEKILKTAPKSMGGNALGYIVNEWKYLIACFSSGEVELDNNFIESHIRPFTIGRKNWMFSATPEGASSSANIYSLVETAKAN